jgi:hypothetical protein
MVSLLLLNFKKGCELKHQQQTFSEVGVKHQNGHAEQSIQTTMSIACTFMIHVSLQRDEQGSDAVVQFDTQFGFTTICQME